MARLVITKGNNEGSTYDLGQTQTIGRLRRNQICIAEDEGASREHARIYSQGDRWLVVDLNSSNGIHVNGKPVQKGPIESGDTLLVGHTLFRFEGDVSAVTVRDEAPAAAGKRPSRDSSAMDGAISFGGQGGTGAASSRVIMAKDKKTSDADRPVWLTGDLGQMGGSFKALLILGVAALMLGLGYLAYTLTAG